MNDGKEQKNSNKYYRAIFVFLGGTLGQILVFVISNVVGAVFSPNWIEALIVSVVLVSIGLFSWFIVGILSWYLLLPKKEISNEQEIISQIGSANQMSVCNKNACLCCLSKALKLPDIHMEIDAETKAKCRLFDMHELYKKERNGSGNGKKWDNIWIFSENLSTELSNNEAEPILITNITNNTKYSMFYLDTEQQRIVIENRKKCLLDSIRDRKYKQNLLFYPLQVKHGYIGKNTLPLLCGSILFSNTWDDRNEMPFFNEGYLSMRRNPNDAPIYYKMPRCMLRQYAIYFKNVVKNSNKEQ